MRYNPHAQHLIPRLTAIWAVSESGLGGVLHAIKLPFSGLILASFAVCIITYIAREAKSPGRAIWQATLLVIFVKAAASPHSPITAYLAVAFQGALGAALFSTLGVRRWVAMLFGMLALLESGFQKLVTLSLIFGKALWEALDLFLEWLTAGWQLEGSLNAMGILLAYFSVYAIAGLLAGIVAMRLPKTIQSRALALADFPFTEEKLRDAPKKRRKRRMFLFIGLLLFICVVFVFIQPDRAISAIILRTLAGIVLLFFVIQPLASYALKKWVQRSDGRFHTQFQQVFDQLPLIRSNLRYARQYALSFKGKRKQMRAFFLAWIALSLYYEPS